MKNKKISVKAIDQKMVSARKLKNLPEDYALWLIYRRSEGEPIPLRIAGELRPDVKTHQVDSFFGARNGILKIPQPKRTLTEIYKKFKLDKPSDQEIEKMIQKCEDEYGEIVDELIQDGGRKGYTKK